MQEFLNNLIDIKKNYKLKKMSEVTYFYYFIYRIVLDQTKKLG